MTHRRLSPVEHSLEYKVFSLLLDLDELPALDQALKRFSRSRINLYSFHDRDHGAGQPENLADYIRVSARRHGIDADGPLELLCYPRILGYVFNPLAVYFLHNAEGVPSGVLYEVSNTFGERHAYLIPTHQKEGDVIRQSTEKRFHVSPFMAMHMRYFFRVRRPAEEAHIFIRETDVTDDQDATVLHAAFHGRRVELSDAALASAFRRHPLMTIKVMAGIHLEAARLMLKGMRLRAGDPTPPTPITFVPAIRT